MADPPTTPVTPTADAEFGFGLFTPEMRADPYPLYAVLREQTPLFSPSPGLWVATRYDQVAAMLRDEPLGRDFRKATLYQTYMAEVGHVPSRRVPIGCLGY